MGVVAAIRQRPPAVRRVQEVSVSSSFPLYGAAAAYALVVGAAIWRHEPWADEAQAWLLARDASLTGLWTHLLHYEGTPGLWHTLLHVLIRLGFPYAALNVFSGILGFAAIWLLLKYAPLPLAIRLFLPFTFFLCYQYPVIARSYSLTPLLLFACALLYAGARQRAGALTILLCLLAAISLHAMMLAVGIWLAYQIRLASEWKELGRAERKSIVIAGAGYAVFVAAMAWSAWPASDGAFATHRDFSFLHLISFSNAAFTEAFTGQWLASWAALALSIPLLWKGRALLPFVLSAALLSIAGAVVYANLWHDGFLFLAWLFAIWIAAARVKPGPGALASLILVIAVQCYWTARSVGYDWAHAYSGSKAAAAYLKTSGIPARGLYGLGFVCTAVQPYFARNAFRNFNRGGPAYWDWSTHNRADDPVALFLPDAPNYVLAGYKTIGEKERWSSLMRMGSYAPIRHFDGNVYWRSSILQPESFDLYRRGAHPLYPTAESMLTMVDAGAAHQLLSGFYGVEANAWRWTARRFAVLLQPPPGAGRNGATLLLRLFLPASQLAKLGPMTLTANINGRPLPPRTFGNSGEATYSAAVPSNALAGGVVPVSFSFDKASPPTAADARELGAVVRSVGLEVK